MGKKRIIVTCPTTDIAVITDISYEEVARPRRNPLLFTCPCGEMHRLRFAGMHGDMPRHAAPPDRQGVR
jgi:hypothetical protein